MGLERFLDRFKVRIEFVTPVLGTLPANPELLKSYVIGKAMKEGVELPPEVIEQELAALQNPEDEVEERTTVFPRDNDGDFCMYDYQVRGFFKEACWALKQMEGTESAKLASYKKKIDSLVFVEPRTMKLVLPEGGKPSVLERPLRAQTPQGERVSIARSEMLPAGTKFEFTVILMAPKVVTREMVLEWLDYGEWKGFLQWRTGSHGRFRYEIVKEK